MKMPDLPPLEDEDRAFLHYNPNTQDLEDFVRAYALQYAESVREACAQAVEEAYSFSEKSINWRAEDHVISEVLEECAAAIRRKED